MFKDLLELIRAVVELSRDMERHRGELMEIRKDLHDLTLLVNKLAQDMREAREEEERRRAEILALLNEKDSGVNPS